MKKRPGKKLDIGERKGIMLNMPDAVSADRKKKSPEKIDIYRAWCKACGICASFCPTGVLGRDEAGYPFVEHLDKCINCGWCETRCPDFAITVQQKKEDAKRENESPEKV